MALERFENKKQIINHLGQDITDVHFSFCLMYNSIY